MEDNKKIDWAFTSVSFILDATNEIGRATLEGAADSKAFDLAKRASDRINKAVEAVIILGKTDASPTEAFKQVGINFAAGVVKLVDALDSKSSSERSVGSIPTARTTFSLKINDVPKQPKYFGAEHIAVKHKGHTTDCSTGAMTGERLS